MRGEETNKSVWLDVEKDLSVQDMAWQSIWIKMSGKNVIQEFSYSNGENVVLGENGFFDEFFFVIMLFW